MSRLHELSDVVSPEILRRAEQVSAQLGALGIPHALVGGLAVGVHGYPRGTKDVDFLVGSEAFASLEPLLQFREELSEIVRAGETDIMSVPVGHGELAEELGMGEEVPVISLPGLVLMKLLAFRPRDREDVRALLLQDSRRIRQVRDHLLRHAPELVHRLAEALAP